MNRLGSLFRRTHTATICKHRTKIKGVITAFGENSTLTMPNPPEYCLRCIEKMSIRCAWCGKSITIGDGITLYSPKLGCEIPAHAVKFSDDPQCLVGCLRWNCCISGADINGSWVPPGKVEYSPSPMELALITGKTVFVSQMSNYPAGVSLVDIGK